MLERGADLDRRHVLVRRAGFGNHGRDQQVTAFGEVLRHAAHHRGAIERGHVRPDTVVERPAGGVDGLVDLRERRGLDLGDRFLGRGVLDRERRSVTGDVLAVDERLPSVYQGAHADPLIATAVVAVGLP